MKILFLLLGTFAALAILVAAKASIPATRPGQGWVAGQFLRAVLRADYPAAYRRLAPEVRRSVTLKQFRAVTRPLWESGQRPDQRIALYKLGMRFEEGGSSRLFYDFMFVADSSLQAPLLLEVTFRDTVTRTVLGFGLRPPKQVTSKPEAKKRSSKK